MGIKKDRRDEQTAKITLVAAVITLVNSVLTLITALISWLTNK